MSQSVDVRVEAEREDEKQDDNHCRHANAQCNAEMKRARVPSTMIRKEQEDGEEPSSSAETEADEKGALDVEVEWIHPFRLRLLVLCGRLRLSVGVGDRKGGLEMQRRWPTRRKRRTGTRVRVNAVVGGDGRTGADCRPGCRRWGGRRSGRRGGVAADYFGAGHDGDARR